MDLGSFGPSDAVLEEPDHLLRKARSPRNPVKSADHIGRALLTRAEMSFAHRSERQEVRNPFRVLNKVGGQATKGTR